MPVAQIGDGDLASPRFAEARTPEGYHRSMQTPPAMEGCIWRIGPRFAAHRSAARSFLLEPGRNDEGAEPVRQAPKPYRKASR
jgi:hypothetical protein